MGRILFFLSQNGIDVLLSLIGMVGSGLFALLSYLSGKDARMLRKEKDKLEYLLLKEKIRKIDNDSERKETEALINKIKKQINKKEKSTVKNIADKFMISTDKAIQAIEIIIESDPYLKFMNSDSREITEYTEIKSFSIDIDKIF